MVVRVVYNSVPVVLDLDDVVVVAKYRTVCNVNKSNIQLQ